MKKDKKIKYYSLKNILARDCQYNMIIGERSNGKTYSVLLHGLTKYCQSNGEEQMAIVRRWQDDFRGRRGDSMFESIVKDGHVERLTNGEYTTIYYYSARWYLAKWDAKLQKKIPAEKPFAYAFAISTQEHDKSSSYPGISTILFDEFLSRDSYLPDEFVKFQNTLSTIIRQRNNVTIFMCGNTVNRYSPYFAEMGLTNVKDQQPGTIDVYTYGDSGLKVAVEYCESLAKDKPSNVYFAFDNPKLAMITGGAWEIDLYPHLPAKYEPRDVLFKYYISFDDELLECEIVQVGELNFTYIHRKSTPLRSPDRDLIFCPVSDARSNWRRNMMTDTIPVARKIAKYFREDRVFYQSNEIGEIVRNFIQNS